MVKIQNRQNLPCVLKIEHMSSTGALSCTCSKLKIEVLKAHKLTVQQIKSNGSRSAEKMKLLLGPRSLKGIKLDSGHGI